MTKETQAIQETAGTIWDLATQSTVPYAKEMLEQYEQLNGSVKIMNTHFSPFVVARYLANHTHLESVAHDDLQVIELGAGFTPHALNLSDKVKTYIEVDHNENSEMKQTIHGQLKKNHNVTHIGGDILAEETWAQIKEKIDPNMPVYVFSEGVVSQYFTDEEKQKLSTYLTPLLQTPGSYYVADDTLRNHSELDNHPEIIKGKELLSQNSNGQYKTNSGRLMDEKLAWYNRFNRELRVGMTKYPTLESHLDFALEKFRLIVCKQYGDKK